MKMSLDQFALEASDALNMTKKDAKAHVQAIFDLLAENMAEGHEVNIPGFGKFRSKHRAEREARNPSTGEMVTVAAKTVPNFLAAKQLKMTVNGDEA